MVQAVFALARQIRETDRRNRRRNAVTATGYNPEEKEKELHDKLKDLNQGSSSAKGRR